MIGETVAAPLSEHLYRLRWTLVRRFGWLGLPGLVGLALLVAAAKVLLIDVSSLWTERGDNAPPADAIDSARGVTTPASTWQPSPLPGRESANTIALELMTVLALSGLQVSDVTTATGAAPRDPSSDTGVGALDLQVVAVGQYPIVKRALSDVLEAFPTMAVTSISLDKEVGEGLKYALKADVRLRYYFALR
ncbi:MAG: hypothetical protein ACK54C_09830 [Betaproteobacteria bacterium]